MSIKNILKRFTSKDSRNDEIEQQSMRKSSAKEHDQFMGRIYKAVSTHRDSEAIFLLLQRFDIAETPSKQYEELFDHMHKWGPSRVLLCLGRLIIETLNEERRYGRALFFIEKCQQVSPQFILADLSQTVFYAKMAVEADKLDVARNLISDPEKRYGEMVNLELCNKLITHINLA
ncbi:MAG: hypothetical protein GY744_13005 [Gammaproteobacteria bacterium]|nr:hypothetical protein [Gammaproteobacteria bacterium]